MWRAARPGDDDAVVEMFLQLNQEDPGATPVAPEQMRRTLAVLRHEPWRGRAVVLQVGQHPVGYALLIAFWSNELGGEVCQVDELFVSLEYRSQGHGGTLFVALERGELWPAPVVALALGVAPDNTRARRLYERLGFTTVGMSMVRRLASDCGVGTKSTSTTTTSASQTGPPPGANNSGK